MTGSSGFGNPGRGLVLSGADTVLKASFAAIQQAIEHFDLFGGEGLAAVLLPEASFGQHSVDTGKGLLQTLRYHHQWHRACRASAPERRRAAAGRVHRPVN